MYISYQNYNGGINNLVVVESNGVITTSLKDKETAIKNHKRKLLKSFNPELSKKKPQNKYGYTKMFLVKFTVNGEEEKVRMPKNSEEEVRQQFCKSFSPNCILNEIIDITDWN